LTTRAPLLTPVGLTLLSAALYALCFPPVSLAPLAWIALVPLLAAASRALPGSAAACSGASEARPRTPIRGRREPVDVYVLSLASGAA